MPEAFSRVNYLKSSSLSYAVALPENVRQGYKYLPGANTVAYYENFLITGVRMF
jgi:hypothetical protein